MWLITNFQKYILYYLSNLKQEQLRKRREEEEKIAAQNDFLRASIRGSRKLQSLQQESPLSNSIGFENIAYSADEDDEEEKIYGKDI